VLLPHPLGPRSICKDPRLMLRSTPFRICRWLPSLPSRSLRLDTRTECSGCDVWEHSACTVALDGRGHACCEEVKRGWCQRLQDCGVTWPIDECLLLLQSWRQCSCIPVCCDAMRGARVMFSLWRRPVLAGVEPMIRIIDRLPRICTIFHFASSNNQ
jgi:hypothetical protein